MFMLTPPIPPKFLPNIFKNANIVSSDYESTEPPFANELYFNLITCVSLFMAQIKT